MACHPKAPTLIAIVRVPTGYGPNARGNDQFGPVCDAVVRDYRRHGRRSPFSQARTT
jgi:hypothetical protein